MADCCCSRVALVRDRRRSGLEGVVGGIGVGLGCPVVFLLVLFAFSRGGGEGRRTYLLAIVRIWC